MTAMFVQPKWWPFCVFAGVMAVVTNNYFVWARINRANDEAKVILHDSALAADHFLLEFGRWWRQMLIYGAMCLVFGVFLYFHVLKDELAYAVLIILFNYFQIVRVIIGHKGYEMRGGIKRLFSVEHRLSFVQT